MRSAGFDHEGMVNERWAKRAANDQPDKVKPRRTISAAGRKRIAAAQRARWAKVKAPQAKKAA
jgi:hypothetical protein